MENKQNDFYSAYISMTMYGIKKCSGGCLYCTAAHTMGYREPDNNVTFKKDWKAVTKTLNKDPQIAAGKNYKNRKIRVDIWGGNPLENFEPFKETVEFLQGYFKDWDLSLNTSGNGLELQSEDLVNYLIDNHIEYQLSHDGLGQWIRTGEIDPIYWDKTSKAIIKMAKSDILTSINCTLSKYNYSFNKNIEYFNKWRIENNLLDKPIYIKLNHIYDGTAPIKKVNVLGHWQDTYDESLKGTEIGSLLFSGKILEEYLHEFKMLYFMFANASIAESLEYKPYVKYIRNQGSRFCAYEDENDERYGACRSFQRGIKKTTFVIDTIGKYTECNLIDSSFKTVNSGGYQPDYCKNCRYKMQNECNPCGSELFPPECNYHYRWVQTLEEISIIESNITTNSCSCNTIHNNHTNIDCIKNNTSDIIGISCKKDFNF